MRFELETVEKRRPNVFETYSLIALVCASVWVWLSMRQGFETAHLSEGFVGPFRGGTRAVASLLEVRVLEGIQYNPLAVVLMLMTLIGALRFLVLVLPFSKRPMLKLTPKSAPLVYVIVIAAIGANWVYVIMAEPWKTPWPG